MQQLDLDGNRLALMMNYYRKNCIGEIDDDNEIEKLLLEYGIKDLSKLVNLKSHFKRLVFKGPVIVDGWLVTDHGPWI